jgi:hypothetical protein
MSTRRVTANLTAEHPDAATEATGKDVNEAPVEDPIKAKQRRFYEKLMALRGKVKFDIDLDELRGRRRH